MSSICRRITSALLDNVYQANSDKIALFPFGQKVLSTPRGVCKNVAYRSLLDRKVQEKKEEVAIPILKKKPLYFLAKKVRFHDLEFQKISFRKLDKESLDARIIERPATQVKQCLHEARSDSAPIWLTSGKGQERQQQGLEQYNESFSRFLIS